jgi:hypothetical protein
MKCNRTIHVYLSPVQMKCWLQKHQDSLVGRYTAKIWHLFTGIVAEPVCTIFKGQVVQEEGP